MARERNAQIAGALPESVAPSMHRATPCILTLTRRVAIRVTDSGGARRSRIFRIRRSQGIHLRLDRNQGRFPIPSIRIRTPSTKTTLPCSRSMHRSPVPSRGGPDVATRLRRGSPGRVGGGELPNSAAESTRPTREQSGRFGRRAPDARARAEQDADRTRHGGADRPFDPVRRHESTVMLSRRRTA